MGRNNKKISINVADLLDYDEDYVISVDLNNKDSCLKGVHLLCGSDPSTPPMPGALDYPWRHNLMTLFVCPKCPVHGAGILVVMVGSGGTLGC